MKFILFGHFLEKEGQSLKKETLKLKAYNFIKEKIISCEYAPNTLLSEESLRNEINASRTPIRDALSRLEQEGLIIIMPKKGIMVSGLSISEIHKIFEVRMLFEPFALQNYGYKIHQDKLKQYYDFFSDPKNILDKDRFYHVDDELHYLIIKAMNNRYIEQTYDSILNQNLRFRVLTGKETDQRLKDTSQEHLKILDLCLQQNWESAAKAMYDHLEISKKATFGLLLHPN